MPVDPAGRTRQLHNVANLKAIHEVEIPKN